MNIIVFGCGMYVAGSKYKNESPILSAITQFTIDNQECINLIVVLADESSIKRNKQKLKNNRVYNFLAESEKLLKTTFIKEEDIEEYLSKVTANRTVALVCSPDYKHMKQSQYCLKMGVNTLIMKPAVCNLHELEELTRTLRESDGECFVEHHKRFDPQIKVLKNLVQNSSNLMVQDIVIEYGQPFAVANEIFNSWESVSDPFTYIGCHYVDLISYLFEANIIRTKIFSSKVKGLIDFVRNSDCVRAVIEWDSENYGSFVSYLCCNWIEPLGSDAVSRQSMNVLTNQWRIELDQKCRGIKVTNSAVNQINPHYIYESLEKNIFEATGYAIDSIKGFIEYSLCGKKGFKAYACSLDQSYATIKALEDVRNSFIK